MKSILIVLLAIASVAWSENEETTTKREDRSIITIRVDQKGSSYIIHPDISRLEAEALMLATRANSTSFFYNVTGLEPSAVAEALDGPATTYRSTGGAGPAKRLIQALLHEIASERPSPESSVEHPDNKNAQWVVHGDPIHVEDVTNQVFRLATDRVAAQRHGLVPRQPANIRPVQNVQQPIIQPVQQAPRPPPQPASSVRVQGPTTSVPAPARLVTWIPPPTGSPQRALPARVPHQPVIRPLPPAAVQQSRIEPVNLPKSTSKPTSTSTTTTTTTSTTTTTTEKAPSKRPEDPNLRFIEVQDEEDPLYYEEEYEDETEESLTSAEVEQEPHTETATSSSAGTTKVTTAPSTGKSSKLPGLIVTIPSAVEKSGYVPLNQGNQNARPTPHGLITLSTLNAQGATAKLPEFTVKTGPGGSSSILISSSVPPTSSTTVSSSTTTTTSTTTSTKKPTTTVRERTTKAPTTTKTPTTTTAKPFNFAELLLRVAGEAGDLLLSPPLFELPAGPGGSSDRPLPSLMNLFAASMEKRRKDQQANRPQENRNPPQNRNTPPPRRGPVNQFTPPVLGIVNNLNRPSVFTGFRQSPPVPIPITPSVKVPLQIPSRNTYDEAGHHTRPNTDALIPLFSSPTEQPQEPEIITAPSQWNMVVSSSLFGGNNKKVVVPPSSLSHRHGYVIDEGEQEERETALHGVDGLVQHPDSPSRLGVSIDYDSPSGSSIQPSRYIPVPHSEQEYEYDDYANDQPVAPVVNRTHVARPAPFPYGLNLGDLIEEVAAPDLQDQGPDDSEELEGVGAAFPELISNSVRKPPVSSLKPTSPTTTTPIASSSTVRKTTRPAYQTPPSRVTKPSITEDPYHYEHDPHDHDRHDHDHHDYDHQKPEVVQPDQAIDAYDKKLGTVEVDDLPVKTTTIPHLDDEASEGLSGAALTYILIGAFGGLTLLFLCAVGITIRCKKRRFQFSTFTTTLMRRADRQPVSDEESQSGSPTVTSSRRISNQQLVSGGTVKGGKDEVSTHKLGPWFNGRNSMSSIHGSLATGTGRKLRAEMALPSTTPNTPGTTGRKVVTRAYFTDGRTGSTRDLITSGASDSSRAESPNERTPDSPQLPERNSWLHTSYKERGTSVSELRDTSYYCVAQAESQSDDERPRSTSATVRSPLQHFSSSELLDSIEMIPPDLPPKRSRGAGAESFTGVDPMGSHVTLQSEQSVSGSHWGVTSLDDRLV